MLTRLSVRLRRKDRRHKEFERITKVQFVNARSGKLAARF